MNAALMVSALAAGLVLSAAAAEPDYYVEYIESTYPGLGAPDADSPWIDTEFRPDLFTRVEMDFQLTYARTSLQPTPFGVSYGTFWFGLFHNGSAVWAINFVHGAYSKGKYYSTGLAADDTSRFHVVFDAQERFFAMTNLNTSVGAKINMSSIGTFAVEEGDVCDCSLPLCGQIKGEDAAPANRAKMKIYSCNIYEKGETVRQFRPAVKDGVAGLWDKQNERFYASKTARAFIAGKKNLWFCHPHQVIDHA